MTLSCLDVFDRYALHWRRLLRLRTTDFEPVHGLQVRVDRSGEQLLLGSPFEDVADPSRVPVDRLADHARLDHRGLNGFELCRIESACWSRGVELEQRAERVVEVPGLAGRRPIRFAVVRGSVFAERDNNLGDG